MSEKNQQDLSLPLLSIIVPVYNAEQYLQRCIESLINQTYKNLDLILVDDGSTDESGAICDSFQEDDRVKVFHTQNRGQASARNFGLKHATGDYITFVDDDDWIDANMYEKLISCAIQYNKQITGCATATELPGGGTRNTFSDLTTGSISGEQCILDILYQTSHAWGAMWNKIYKAELFDGRYFPDGKQLEDYKLVTELYYTVKQIYFVAEPMYHWCMRDNSQSKKGFSQEKLTVINTAEEIRDYFRHNSGHKDIVSAANYFVFREYADVMWSRCNSSGSIDKQTIKSYQRKGFSILNEYLKTSSKEVDMKRVIKLILATLF